MYAPFHVDGQDLVLHDQVQPFAADEPVHDHHAGHPPPRAGELPEEPHLRAQYVSLSVARFFLRLLECAFFFFFLAIITFVSLSFLSQSRITNASLSLEWQRPKIWRYGNFFISLTRELYFASDHPISRFVPGIRVATRHLDTAPPIYRPSLFSPAFVPSDHICNISSGPICQTPCSPRRLTGGIQIRICDSA
jgi:hypothetical protein